MELQKHSNEISTSLIGSKQKVFQAIQQPKLFVSTDEDLKSVMKYIFVLVGLRDIPTDIRKDVLFQYIRENYKNYSLQELKLAFELALKKEFVCEIRHYEMFSPSYFSGVFEAYIEYRSEIARKFMMEQQAKELKPKELTIDEIKKLKNEFYVEILEPLFENFRLSNKLEFGMVPVRVVYEALKKDYSVIDLTESEMQEIKQKAKQIKNVYSDGLNKFIGTKETPEERFKNSCQKMAIEYSFKKLINRNTNLKNETDESN